VFCLSSSVSCLPNIAVSLDCPFLIFLQFFLWRVWRYQREVIRIRISKKNRQSRVAMWQDLYITTPHSTAPCILRELVTVYMFIWLLHVFKSITKYQVFYSGKYVYALYIVVYRFVLFFFLPLLCLFFFDIRILITSLWYLKHLWYLHFPPIFFSVLWFCVLLVFVRVLFA
jgi:hypothetical protein